MTADKQFKNEVRRFATAHSLSFADARRRVLAAKEAEAASLVAGRGAPDVDVVMAGMAAQSSVDGILARQRETMALINKSVVQDPVFAVVLRTAKEMAQFQVNSAAEVASESVFQERLRQQQEWTKSLTQSAAAAAVPTGLLDQVSKHHAEIVNAARRSVVGGSAAEEAKKAFLEGIRRQEEAAAVIVGNFTDSIGAKAAQGVLDSVASLEKDAMKSMASVWKLEQPRVDQSWLQRQVLFRPPVTEAAAPAWALPTATNVKASSVDRDAEITAALADVQERQERIEKLLQQLVDKDKGQE